MKKKDNKKQLDAEINRMLLNDFDKIENFVAGNWKKMCIAAGIIVVLVAVAYGIMLKKENNELVAQRAVANAATQEQLVTVIDRYKAYKEADFARIKLARIYVEQKSYDKAMALYKTVAQNTQDSELKSQMLLCEAYMLECSGKFVDAAKAFDTIGGNSMFAKGVRAEAYYSAMRLTLKAKQKDAAVKAFDKLNLLAGDDVAAAWINLAKSLNVK